MSTAILDLMFWPPHTCPGDLCSWQLGQLGVCRNCHHLRICILPADNEQGSSSPVVWLIDLVGKLLTFIASLAWSIVTLPCGGQELVWNQKYPPQEKVYFSPGLRWRNRGMAAGDPLDGQNQTPGGNA